jgi:hypothetical protein
VSRNPQARICSLLCCFLGAAPFAGAGADPAASLHPENSRVVIVHDAAATDAFQARPDVVRAMVRLGATKFTGKTNVAEAWRTLVSTQDVVGIKVYCGPGSGSGTRPAVVEGVIEGLLASGVPAKNIILWDRQRGELRLAGYFEVAARHGVRVEGAVNAGYDEEVFYNPERPILGQLVYGDLEFARKGEGVGRRSYVSKLVTKRLTKIINITPLLNHNAAGVCGNLFSLASGSVDNFHRFEPETFRLATAVPEIFALPQVGDRAVLHITDALVCQYHGEQRSLLHYSIPLNELRFSKDPVALDLLSLRELDRQRQTTQEAPRSQSITNHLELIQNAALLELGTGEADKIRIERVP